MMIQWQFYWTAWYLGYDERYDRWTGITVCYLFVGPLQMKWYKK